MGTSTNQPSPNIPRWRPVAASLGNSRVSLARQSAEIWRAASSDREGLLVEELSNPLLAEACRIAEDRTPVSVALKSFDSTIRSNHAAGLTLDIGKRALARAVTTKSGATGFASELFAEVASYYVSRDLPSYTAARGRVGSTSEAVALKNDIKSIARETALKVGSVHPDPTGWRSYIANVIASLQNMQAEE